MKVYCLSSAFSSACLSRNWSGELMKIYKGQGGKPKCSACHTTSPGSGGYGHPGTIACPSAAIQSGDRGRDTPPTCARGCGSRDAWGWCVGSTPSEKSTKRHDGVSAQNRRLPHKALQVPVIKLADQSSDASDKGDALADTAAACSLFSTFHHVDISL